MQLVGWRFMNFYIKYLYQSGTFHKPNGSFVKLRRVLIVSWNQIMVFVGSYCGNSVLLDISVYQVFNLGSNFNDKFQIWHPPVFELHNLWNMVIGHHRCAQSFHNVLFDTETLILQRIKWINRGKSYAFDNNLKAGDFQQIFDTSLHSRVYSHVKGKSTHFPKIIFPQPSSDRQVYTAPLDVVLFSPLLLGKVGINLGFAAPQLSNHICPALMKWGSRKDSRKKQLPPGCLTHVSWFLW